MDLSVATPTQILGKINAHEMYMHINDKDESSFKRKDLALKANQERKGKAKVQIEEESSSDDDLDANNALMVRKTTKMLKKLNREGIKFDSRKKKFFSVKESPFLKWIATTVESLFILLINATSPRRTSSRTRKNMAVMMRKRKRDSSRGRMGSTRGSTKRKMGRHTLLVTGSLTLSHQVGLLQVKKKNDEKVAAIAGDFSSPPPTPSSTSHLCLMARGERKVQNDNDIIDDSDSDSDSDDEFASPSYDELAEFLKEYTQIIRKSKAKCDKLKYENEFLNAKYDIVMKASDEMKEENKNMSSTINELTSSLKDAKDKSDKLNKANRELKDRLVKIKV
jgi:hypothetical protein